jgi:hypothetical protein
MVVSPLHLSACISSRFSFLRRCFTFVRTISVRTRIWPYQNGTRVPWYWSTYHGTLYHGPSTMVCTLLVWHTMIMHGMVLEYYLYCQYGHTGIEDGSIPIPVASTAYPAYHGGYQCWYCNIFPYAIVPWMVWQYGHVSTARWSCVHLHTPWSERWSRKKRAQVNGTTAGPYHNQPFYSTHRPTLTHSRPSRAPGDGPHTPPTK